MCVCVWGGGGGGGGRESFNTNCTLLQAYCLKVKEMDDEEYEAAVSQPICRQCLNLKVY